ncbi:hypothetical protein HYS11_00885, partial [Candidatus Gottesmanbacteria bacterium]|nr:hypothetical protein [Candidatus Gottesmanbacteria bacterium]
MKTIVTHFYPDVDAVCSVWLVKTFLSNWYEATVAFVPAGSTLDGRPVDSDSQVIHVDTGLGQFDHHQTRDHTCATKLVFEHLRELKIKSQKLGLSKIEGLKVKKNEFANKDWHEEALERLIAVVNDIDHFGQIFWPEPASDRYDFSLEAILDGWKLLEKGNDREIIERGMMMIDGIYATLINKVWAEEELTKKRAFNTVWGKAFGIETVNDECLKLGLKQGYALVVRKDPHKGYVRIKANPKA